MIGVKEICALLMAGSMGAGSVVAVQEARPAVQKMVKRSTGKPAKPKVQKAAARPASSGLLMDCPTMVAPLGEGFALPNLATMDSLSLGNQVADTSRTPGFAPASYIGGYGGGLGIPGIGSGGAGGGGGYIPGTGGGGEPSITPPGVTPAVPQPATWAMMVTGFGLVGLAIRKKEAVFQPQKKLPNTRLV